MFVIIGSMKNVLILKPEIIQKQNYNKSRETSLSMLCMANKDLKLFLYNKASTNPFLSFQTVSDEIINYQASAATLSDTILSKLSYLNVELDEDICYYLLSQLDSNGYFRCSMKDLCKQSIYTQKQLEKVISILQTLDPVGCFCFSLKESLQVQAFACEEAESETAYILCSYLEDLANHNLNHIMEETQMDVEEIQEGLRFIQSLNPKPASGYASFSQYMEAEASVEVKDGKIQIQLLKQDFTIEIDEEMQKNKQMQEEYKQLYTEAKNIMNFIQKRNATIMQILQIVCQKQKDYFLHGKALQYCTMQQIAKECDVNVSTISRAVTGKMLQFQNRYIPLRYFFVRNGNKEHSQEELVDKIKEYIESENPKTPYSDEKLKALLEKEGIYVSRRTIAKYRELAQIENASKRKKRKGEKYERKN